MKETNCSKCHKPVSPGQLMCDCGNIISQGGTDSFEVPKVDMPDLNLGSGGNFSIDLPRPSSPFERQTGVKEPDLSNVELNLSGESVAQTNNFNPVFIIDKAEDGENILRMPFSISLLNNGKIYVINFTDEEGSTKIQLFDAEGKFIKVIRHFESGEGNDAFDTPTRIGSDDQENIYVADMGESCIKKFSSEGEFLLKLGGEGNENTNLREPRDVKVDTQGNIFVADTGNNRIVKWDKEGNPLMTLGINEVDEDTDWLMAGEEPGEFDEPYGMALDKDENIWIADTNNHRVQKFGPSGDFLKSFGEEGESAGQLYYPRNIEIDQKDNMYITDSVSGRIQKFDPEGDFIWQIILPGDAGIIEDLEVDSEGRCLVNLRESNMILNLEAV